ncbi:N-6 DNA methylase [Streptomyces sp. NPDC003703]|uniref:N-6 DNA methylase n=1 Tax=Streptomyces sp. NPDC003283 TaxID=3364681 RepID=UPI0036A2D991
MAEEPTTVTATGIARIAGVGRPAVSNWRRRHQDFPRPVAGTSASPAFDLREVERWLDRQGKLRPLAPLGRLTRCAETFGAAGRPAEALALAGLALLTAPAEAPTPDRLGDAVRAVVSPRHAGLLLTGLPPAWSAAQRELLEAARLVAYEEDRVRVLEHLHAWYATARGTAGLTDVPTALAGLMLDLTGPADSVLDSACGTGTFLRPALEESPPGRPPRILGQDRRPEYVRIALLRLLLLRSRAGAGADPEADGRLRLGVGGPFPEDAFAEETVDAVVGGPPPDGLQDWTQDRFALDSRWLYGGPPPRSEPELAWAQQVLARLRPGGRAALLMPAAVAGRSTGRRIRGELVRRGVVRAVVGLPPTTAAGNSNGAHLWVLQRPEAAGVPDAAVLLVTAEAVRGDRHASPGDPFDVLRRRVRDLWAGHRTGHGTSGTEGVIARRVPRAELLDEDADLTPRRHVPGQGGAYALDAVLRMPAALEARLAALRVALPRPDRAPRPEPEDVSTATLGELSRTGALTLHRHPARAAGQESPGTDRVEPALTGQDVAAGRPASGSLPVRPGTEPAARVQAHDILVPSLAGDLVAKVATEEQIGARLGPGVHAVRVDPDLLDPWFVAGAVTHPDNAARAARPSVTASGALRIDVKRLRLPLLPVDVQRRRGSVLRGLDRWGAELTRTAEAGQALARAFTAALIDGKLAAPDD